MALLAAQSIADTFFKDYERKMNIWSTYKLPTMGQFTGEWVKDTAEWQVYQMVEEQKNKQIVALQAEEGRRWQNVDVWYEVNGYWYSARSVINDKFGWLHFPQHKKVTDFDQYIWDLQAEQRRYIEGDDRDEYIRTANMDLGDTVRLDLTVFYMDYDNFGEPRSFSAKLKEPYNKHSGRLTLDWSITGTLTTPKPFSTATRRTLARGTVEAGHQTERDGFERRGRLVRHLDHERLVKRGAGVERDRRAGRLQGTVEGAYEP